MTSTNAVMMVNIYYLPCLTLASILVYGAFSRLSHGVYTPQWYAYQCERQHDDGSLAALLVPVMDLGLAMFLLLPGRRSRLGAASAFVLMQSIGLVMQISVGRDWTGDVLLLGLGALAAVCV